MSTTEPTRTAVIGGKVVTFGGKNSSTRRTVPKAEIMRAIRAKCRDCAENLTVIEECDGEFIGYDCALHPYRPGVKVKRQGEDGKLLPEFRKSALLKAIRRECLFCCNNYDPGWCCSSPECSLYRFRRGVNYRRDSSYTVGNDAPDAYVEDEQGEGGGTLPGNPATLTASVECMP
jgi:hypothetical protein